MKQRESFMFDDQRLVIERKWNSREAFFKLTFSPVPGAIRDVSIADKGIANGDGPGRDMPGGVLVTVNETTGLIRARALEAERVRLKEALQAKRIQLLEEVFRNAPFFLHVLRGPEFVFELANDAYYQLVGHRELIGRPAFEALPETAQCGFQHRLTEVMSTCKPFMGFELPVTVIRPGWCTRGTHYRSCLSAPAGR